MNTISSMWGLESFGSATGQMLPEFPEDFEVDRYDLPGSKFGSARGHLKCNTVGGLQGGQEFYDTEPCLKDLKAELSL